MLGTTCHRTTYKEGPTYPKATVLDTELIEGPICGANCSLKECCTGRKGLYKGPRV